ncbi:hypothetical protein GCM10011497_37800 [Elstera cyanobacteriorum]|uniref:Uncharacterized protein n=2 Tax=Elstera cyanobacteriorum TaxID=2022747 RepID=A0A255Y2Z1_9PROT|nr:hypothetical protein CHR90_00020 [Elstera cyanobacteriorum]GGA03942.1 hypothetical protein GCM10011497_37800 [Elstera cyanobacteriorum]
MKAERIFYDRMDLPDGSIIEMVIWKLPVPVLGSEHSLKYRLYYGRNGQRLIGYDNGRGKGDHRHLGCIEEPYLFTTVEALVGDFIEEVKRERGEL